MWCDLRVLVHVYRFGDVVHIHAEGATQLTTIDLLAHAGDTQAEGGRSTRADAGQGGARFAAKAGDRVQRGQALAALDAMKRARLPRPVTV